MNLRHRDLTGLATAVCLSFAVALPATSRAESLSAGTPFVAISTVSYHTRGDDQLNNVNPGIGLGFAQSPNIDVLAGTFKNSYSGQSRYVMARARITDNGDAVAIHLCGGYLDGYANAGASRFGVAVDVQYGPVVLVAAPAPEQGGFSLSIWLMFDPT